MLNLVVMQELIDELDAAMLRIVAVFLSDIKLVMVRANAGIAATIGRIENDGSNFKGASGAPSAVSIVNILNNAGYSEAVDSFIAAYQQLIPIAKDLYLEIDPSFSFSADGLQVLEDLQKYDRVYFDGMAEEAARNIELAIYQFASLQGEIEALTSEVIAALDFSSPIVHGLENYANEAILRWCRTMTAVMLPKPGYWLYFGPRGGRIRPWCAKHVGGVYSDAEVNSWNYRTWQGKAPGDVRVMVGGYNCRHILIPVKKSLVG